MWGSAKVCSASTSARGVRSRRHRFRRQRACGPSRATSRCARGPRGHSSPRRPGRRCSGSRSPGRVRPSRGSVARHGRSYGRICTSRRARLHAHDRVATEIMRLLAQLHDGDVQILQVSRRDAQQPLRLVGPEAAALGVVGDAVERVHGLVVVVAPAAHLALEPTCGGAVEHHGGAGAFHRAVGGQLDEHANELRDGEAVSRREVERPVLLAGREPHVYALAASAHHRSSSSGQVLGGRLPPRGAGHPPQRHRPEGRDARSQDGPHGNAYANEGFIAATDPSPMRAPCAYDIGSLLPFGLYHETARNRAVFGRWLAPAVASR
ncbi:hypothetical protein HMPREF1868_00114 [Olsenella sp. DNF00959]|nr:hypothetical protein HMPREF1868_00114 [Olsenella sp. DNF00959]